MYIQPFLILSKYIVININTNISPMNMSITYNIAISLVVGARCILFQLKGTPNCKQLLELYRVGQWKLSTLIIHTSQTTAFFLKALRFIFPVFFRIQSTKFWNGKTFLLWVIFYCITYLTIYLPREHHIENHWTLL